MPSNTIHNYYFDRFLNNALDNFQDKNEFLSKASLEEKLCVLSKLGYMHAIVVGSPKARPFTFRQLSKFIDMFFKYMTWRRKPNLKVLKEKGFFILSDYDFIRGLRLGANYLNTPTAAGFADKVSSVYRYNFEIQKSMGRDVAAGHDIDGIIMRVIHLETVKGVAEQFKANYGMTDRQYLLLSILSKYREVTLVELRQMMHNQVLAAHTRPLLLKRWIDKKMVTIKDKPSQDHYWITGMGEQALMKARNYFIKHII